MTNFDALSACSSFRDSINNKKDMKNALPAFVIFLFLCLPTSLIANNALTRDSDLPIYSGDLMIVDLSLQDNQVLIEQLKFIPGNYNKRRWKAHSQRSMDTDTFYIHLLDENKTRLFTTDFKFIRIRTIPPSLPSTPDFQTSDMITITNPLVSLILPFTNQVKFIEIISPEKALSSTIVEINQIKKARIKSTVEHMMPAPVQAGKLHFLIMANGFNYSMSTFETLASDLKEYLLTKEPFLSYAESIEFHIYSNTTDLNCDYNCNNIERVICCDDTLVTATAASSGYLFDEIIVIHNTHTYSGSAQLGQDYQSNSYSSYARIYSGSRYKELALHELGHSFGGLCDEYSYANEGFDNALCVNCRALCSDWNDTGSIQCQKGCKSSPYYFRPEDSIMLRLSLEYFNKASLNATYAPDGLIKRIEYFTGSLSNTCALTLDISDFLSPLNGISDTTPVFSWNEDGCATWYKLFVWDSNKNTIHAQWYDASNICSQGICSVTLASEFEYGTFEWFVRSWNEDEGLWTKGKSLTVSKDFVQKISIVSPSGTSETATPTFTWSEDASATWYKIYVKNMTVGSKNTQWYEIEDNYDNYPQVACQSGQCSITPSFILSAGSYEWYVRGWNEYGNGDWSDVLNFIVSE
ncbi:MAG: hypothetical protein GY729_11740 [Desulfobacteraceae bacterium]|nr:hypothetical protein [Desulfobacteraceae bacterium]